jgi:hypothetical protein
MFGTVNFQSLPGRRVHIQVRTVIDFDTTLVWTKFGEQSML